MTRPHYPAVTTAPGVTRQILAEDSQMMVVSFRFETGAEGALHRHPHGQSTYVVRGRFAFFRDGETHMLTAGDSLVMGSNVEHGCRCLEAGELIDCFTPRREDFLQP